MNYYNEFCVLVAIITQTTNKYINDDLNVTSSLIILLLIFKDEHLVC